MFEDELDQRETSEDPDGGVLDGDDESDVDVFDLEEPDEEQLEPDDTELTATVSDAEEDDEDSEASLDQLLDQRAAARARRALDEEEEEFVALVSGADEPTVDRIPQRRTLAQDRPEFVCARCHLVKPRVQLADSERLLCRDCV